MDTHLYTYTVLALGALQSAYIAWFKPWSRKDGVSLEQVSSSSLVSPEVLLAYRLFGVVWVAFIQSKDLLHGLGVFALQFYTVWTWIMLGVYFALASSASLAYLRQRGRRAACAAGGPGDGLGSQLAMVPAPRDAAAAPRGAARERRLVEGGSTSNGNGNGAAPPRGGAAAAWLPNAAAALLHLLCTCVIIVDVVFWAVLAPTLRVGKPADEAARLTRIFFSFASYNQHVGNAALIYVDWLLCAVPFSFHHISLVGAYSLAYAAFAIGLHAAGGKWTYPFLDMSAPTAPVAYLALYAAHWAFYGVFAATAIATRSLLRPSHTSKVEAMVKAA